MDSDTAKNTLYFLERIKLTPSEINAFMAVNKALQDIINTPEKDGITADDSPATDET